MPPQLSFSLAPRSLSSVAAFVVTGGRMNLFGERLRQSDRRRLAAASNERYRAVFETSLDAIAITRLADGICVDVNQSCLDILGYERAEVIGHTMLELGIWVDTAAREHLLDVLKRDARCRNLESRFRKKNGEPGWGMVSAAVIELDGVPCVISMTRDITDLKNAQEELQRHRTQLEQRVLERTADLTAANAKLLDIQFAMESVGIAIHWADANTGRFLYVNGCAAETLGYSVDEMLGMTVADIDPNFNAQDLSKQLAQVHRQRSTRFESVNRTKDGRIIPVEVTVHYLPGGADDPPRCIAFLTDITWRKETERALVQAKEAAEAANVAKSAFLANMSHEIRTPLHVIIGLGHLLRHDIDDPTQRERLDHLCESSDHLLGIINNVLDFSKIEAQEVVIDDSVFGLDTLVAKVVCMVEGRAQEKGLTLDTALAPQLRSIAVRGDPLRLAQVLINLCGNAVKFTHQGSVRLGIDCLAQDTDDVTLRFTVQDTGIGIDAADMARLFKPFTQVDGSYTPGHDGTGLGLAISQRLVALMGGSIEVDSVPGAGSTFSFELVLPRAAASLPQVTAGARPAAGDFYGRHVLFAEDHPLSQEILLEMLEDLGCMGDVAADGAEAVACAQAHGYDLILLDMHMPKMDGLAAARAIRALPGHRDTPIVALTANAFAEDRQRCLDAGMNGHLGKPVTPATLAAALAQWLPDLRAPSDAAPACDSELGRALAAIPGLEVGHAWRRSTARLTEYCLQLDRFAAQHSPEMRRLRGHLAAGERDAAQVLAHNLKGIAGLIGARRIASLANEIEHGLRAGAAPASLGSLANACEAELAALHAATRTLSVPAREAPHG